jgi:hypothetical protein
MEHPFLPLTRVKFPIPRSGKGASLRRDRRRVGKLEQIIKICLKKLEPLRAGACCIYSNYLSPQSNQARKRVLSRCKDMRADYGLSKLKSGKKIRIEAEKARHNAAVRGCRGLLQGNGQSSWRHVSKFDQPVFSRLTCQQLQSTNQLATNPLALAHLLVYMAIMPSKLLLRLAFWLLMLPTKLSMAAICLV